MARLSFLNLLTLIFVVFKLANVIAWSWWLVLMPTIVGTGLGFLVLLFVGFMAALSAKRP